MRALSLTQPWAFLVVHEPELTPWLPLKDIENRRWNTKFRGDFLVHAAKGMRKTDYEAAVAFVRDAIGSGAALQIPPPGALMRGGFVGRARLVDVIPPCTPNVASVVPCRCGRRWHMSEQYGFVLADVVALPFHPYSGALGFFNVPDDKLPAEYRTTGGH